MKKKWVPKLRHPWAQSAAGFTLVELVVVIAIMGILAGVGTVGYSGYVKSAQKKADQTLVGNIVRAIEMGTQSTMFTHDDSFKMGKLAYPVGFITLSDTGVQVVTSKTQMKPNEVKEKGACVFETIEDVLVTQNHPYTSTCGKTTGTTQTYTTGSVTYCTNHSLVAPVIENSDGKTYTADYTHAKGNWLTGCTFGCGGISPVPANYPSGLKIVSNQDSLELLKADNLCEIAYTYQYDTYDSSTTDIAPRTEGALYDSLEAAFGDISGLHLEYDGWTSEEGFSHASANSYVSDAWSELTTMAELLASDGLLGVGVKLYFDKTWNTQEDAMTDGVTAIHMQHGNNESGFLSAWEMTADVQFDQAGFNMNTGNSTNDKVGYNTLRVLYNEAFASYLATKKVPEEYLTVVKTFDNGVSWDGANGKTYYIPAVVNKDAFARDESKLKEKFKKAGDTNAGQEGSWFNKCNAYYEEYLKSPAYDENAKTVLNIVSTVANTSEIAGDDNNAYGGDYVGYYTSYFNEMDALYTAAETAAGDGIVIIVTVENGEVKCDVSPSSADLRLQ